MFGYININKKTLEKGQYGLWHTFLCGICMSLKDNYDNRARLTAGWDVNFLNILLHSVTQLPVTINMAKCASSPLKKRSIMQRDELTDRLATANLLLFYFNAIDDGKDGEKTGKRKVAQKVLKKSFDKAIETAPLLHQQLKNLYEGLLQAEKDDCASIDYVCDFSAKMMTAVTEYVLQRDIKKDEYLYSLCYNVGKWVYVIDALDDLKKDVKSNNYNVLFAWLGRRTDADAFVCDNKEQLEFLFYSTLNKIAESFNDLRLKQYICVLKNVIYESMRLKTSEIFDKYNRRNKNDVKKSL